MNSRIKRYTQYSTVTNEFIRNPNISFKAKAIFVFIQGCADDFDLSARNISNFMKENFKTCNNALQELEELGYLHREQIRLEGKFSHINYHTRDDLSIQFELEQEGKNKPLSCTEKRNTANGYNIKEKSKKKIKEGTSSFQKQKINHDLKGIHGITDSDKELWKEAYPDADVESELKKIHVWLIANPKKAPKSNYRRFINGWISRVGKSYKNANTSSSRASKEVIDKSMEQVNLFLAEKDDN